MFLKDQPRVTVMTEKAKAELWDEHATLMMGEYDTGEFWIMIEEWSERAYFKLTPEQCKILRDKLTEHLEKSA